MQSTAARRAAILSSCCVCLLGACGGPPGDDGGLEMNSGVLENRNRVVTDLICPGAVGCEDADGTLAVGTGKRDITPTLETWTDTDGNGVRNGNEPFNDVNKNGKWDPVWIAGFEPGRAATEIHDPHWTRALSFARGATRIGLVSLDLLGLAHDDVMKIRRAATEAGLDYDHIMVVTTHCHQSKDSLGFAGENVVTSGYDADYINLVVERSVEALADALKSEQSASLTLAQGAAPELVGDSRDPQVIDQTLYALRFDGPSHTIATLIAWGNHAEAFGGDNTRLSSDYPHFLREALEAQYPGSMALYVPGTLGGLTNPMQIVGCPDANGDDTCPLGTVERVEYVGRGAAQVAIDELEGNPVATDPNPTLALRRKGNMLRITNPTLVLGYQLGLFVRGVWDPQGEPIPDYVAINMSFDDILEGQALIQSEVNALTLGPITFVTVPGEIYPELWLAKSQGVSYVEVPAGADYPNAPVLPPLQDHIPSGTIKAIINNGNDAVGYIIPETQWDQEPPYTYNNGTEPPYGEGVSLGHTTARQIDTALSDMFSMELR